MIDSKKPKPVPAEAPQEPPAAAPVVDEPANPINPDQPPSQPERPAGRASSSQGILPKLITRFSTPFPILNTQYITVDVTGMSDFFKVVWDQIITALYPDRDFNLARIITQERFNCVCQYLASTRIQTVFTKLNGARLDPHHAIPSFIEVPECIALVINTIGAIHVQDGAYRLVPQLPVPADAVAAAAAFDALAPADHVRSFIRLVSAAEARGFIRTATITSDENGTPWWMLSARSAVDQAEVAASLPTCQVVSVFKEWSGHDALLSALVQRQNDGLVPQVDLRPKWTTSIITGCNGLRRAFCLKA